VQLNKEYKERGYSQEDVQGVVCAKGVGVDVDVRWSLCNIDEQGDGRGLHAR